MIQYFKTGKTIVIDDQYEEAKPLLKALTKHQIPYIYTQGKPGSEFPLPNTNKDQAQHYNLVFLDLNLDFQFAGGQIGSENEEKTFKGTHANIIETIFKNKNKSFILVIWSNEEENYRDHFLNLFKNDYYTTKRPYKIISLSKSSYFDLTDEGYRFKRDESGSTEIYEKQIFDEISASLNDLEAFKLMCEWDRVVSQSCGDAIDDILGLVNHLEDENDRESYLAKIFTSISIAYSGVEGYLKLSNNQQKTDSVLLTLTQLLNDDIDRNVLLQRQKEFTNWKASDKFEIQKLHGEVSSSSLNSKLLLFKPNRIDLTGSVYLTQEINFDMLVDTINISKLSKDYISAYKKEKGLKGLEDEEKYRLELEYCKNEIFSSAKPVEVNFSPLCDIVQDKIVFHRLVQGYMISANCFSSTLQNSAYYFKTPIFNFNNEDVFIGLDLRYLTTAKIEDIQRKQDSYLFTIRTNLINDFQTKLGAHVSRLGYLYI